MGENHLMNLPASIVIDILARLPPKTVLQCRCVCRAWLHLLCQPEFFDLHLSKSPTCLIANKISSSLSGPAAFSIVEVEDESCRQDVRYIARVNREIPRRRESVCMFMIGSVAGLVCINDFSYHYELIHVWNPITGEFITVKTPGGAREGTNVRTYGFGISAGKYHVVSLVNAETNSHQIQNSTCYVYTIGAGLWKNIGDVPYLFTRRDHGLFLKGKLHWLSKDQDGLELISCLDIEKELFQPFPAPPRLSQQHPASLNVCNGCLSMCDITSDFGIVIWMMKEYGVKNSWSKEVVISKSLLNRRKITCNIVRIVRVFKNGEFLLLCGNDYLFSYHLERKNVHNLNIQETMMGPSSSGNHDVRFTWIEAQDYIPSFVSLKIGEEKVENV